jgi:Helix-hairpin-helix motif
MSSMVDPRPETVEAEPSPAGGPFASLGVGRFALAAAVVGLALALGFARQGVPAPAFADAKVPPELRLDPNTVPPEVLTALPHVGAALVDRWVAARQEQPFRSLEDAQARVHGLGAATLEQLAPYFENWDEQRHTAHIVVRRKTARPPATLQTALRKKSGSSKTSATQSAGLASRPVSAGEP